LIGGAMMPATCQMELLAQVRAHAIAAPSAKAGMARPTIASPYFRLALNVVALIRSLLNSAGGF
jgi:hypothetical protein